MLKFVVALLPLLVFAHPAAAGAPLAGELKAQCAASDPDRSICMTYLRGVIDGAGMAANFSGIPVFCAPLMDGGAMRQIFITWIDANPAAEAQEAGPSVLAAFTQAFPCVPNAKGRPTALTK